jgi:hypothetical protein
MQGDRDANGTGTHTNGKRGANGKAEPYAVPPLPTNLTITEPHARHLATSGLTEATIRDARLYSIESRDETITLLGRTYSLHAGPAIVIPFFEPGAVQPYAYRVRPDAPRFDTKRKRTVKYDQPTGAGVGVMVYYPPRTTRSGDLRNITSALLFTEGEKKALALDQLGYAVVGLTGVDSWSVPREPGARGRRAIHPRILDHVLIAGRVCVLVFDQDAHEKSDVMRAARAFRDSLLEAGAAEVRFITPPCPGESKGIDDFYAAQGEAEVRGLIDSAQPLGPDPASDQDTPISQVECLAGAPVPEGMVIPRGYQVTATGRLVASSDDKSTIVGPRPILVVARSADHITGEESARVAWRDLTGWRVVQVTRRALIDTRGMVAELGPLGAPITSQSARYWAAWFLAFELANEALLPLSRSTQHTGWIGEPGTPGCVFVAHATHGYMLTGEADRVAAALAPRGTLAAHLEALRAAWDTGPVMRRVICAALTPPLLKPLGARGFALHLCGDSSRGKTTMLRIAASIFGDPDHPAWVSTWNSTANAAELRAATLCDLPLIYDEIGASDPVAVQRLIYTLINGESRGRMTSTLAAQRARSWRTVVLSTGEAAIADELATGAQARVLTLDVVGFGTLDGNASEIARLLHACAANSGNFGAQYIADLAGLGPDEWAHAAELRNKYRGIYLEGEAVAGARSRVADAYSLLALVERVLITKYGFTEHGDPLKPGVPSFFAGTEQAGLEPDPIDSAADAMATEIEAWIAGNPDAFPEAVGQTETVADEPKTHHGQRLGVRITDRAGCPLEVWINPRALKDLFTKHRRSYRSVMREWQRDGRIVTEAEAGRWRPDARRCVGQNRARFVVWRPAE